MRASSMVLLLALAACSSQTDQKPAATVKDGKAASPVTPATGKAAPLDVGVSKIGFIGAKVSGDHEGSFGEFTGEAMIDGDKPTGVSITVKTESLVAAPQKLADHLKSPDFFDVQAFPTAKFTSTAITAKADGDSTHVIEGSLELRGVSKTIAFPAQVTVTATGASGKAEFSINRKDFGIEYPGMTDDLIKDNVVLKLDLAFRRG